MIIDYSEMPARKGTEAILKIICLKLAPIG
jgi:hypothetical protein